MIVVFKGIKDKFENICKGQSIIKNDLVDLKKNQIGFLEIKNIMIN